MDEWLLEDMLSAVQYGFERRKLYPSPNDERESEQEPLLFSGNTSAIKPGTSFCWCLMWTGTYSNRYGDDIPDDLRQWGYVFWDRERVIGSGARGLLLRTWRSEHWTMDRSKTRMKR